MNKYNIDIQDLSLFLICLSIFIVIVLFYYRFGLKQAKNYHKALLKISRILSITLLLMLFFKTEIEHFFNKNDDRKSLILVDKSLSMQSFNNEVKEKIKLIEQKRRNSSIETFNDKEMKNITNFVDVINNIDPLKIKEIFLLSDGNQTEYYELKPTYPFPVNTIPIGKLKDPNQLDLKLNKIPDFLDIGDKRDLRISLNNSKVVTGNLIIKLNDINIVNRRLQFLENMTFNNPIEFTKEGKNTIRVSFNDGKKTYRKTRNIFVKNEKKQIIHIFKKPNVEAKFIKLIISENNKINISSYPFFSVPKTLSADFLILSDLETSDIIALSTIVESFSKTPSIIIAEKAFNFLNLFEVKFKANQYQKIKSISDQYSDLILTVEQKSLPKINFQPFEVFQKTRKVETELILNDFMQFITISRNQNYLILSSRDLWKLKLQGQVNLSFNQLYEQLINRVLTKILSKYENVFEFNQKRFLASQKSTLEFSIKNSIEQSLDYDKLSINLSQKSKVIEQKDFSANSTFTLDFISPESGYLRADIRLMKQNKLIYREKKYFNIQTRDREIENSYVNQYLLKEISEISDGGNYIKNIDTIKIEDEKESSILSSERKNLINYETVLTLLILVMSLEWFLRKKLQLP